MSRTQITMAATVMAMSVLATAPTTSAEVSFDALVPNQQIADFRVENVYDNETGMAMGARFRHAPSGFVLDLLRIQSVPQAFMWVNSVPPSDQGEPHTCEHLLLGKGTRGRYVASLEDMSLGNSSAFTMQLETCYHYHTAAGADVFFDLMDKKLEAMLHPTFSDEEIRREVCNMGVTVNPTDSSLSLEEKGTVYNEMVSSYERPWAQLFRQLGILLYGQRHPLALESGGLPDSIRTMTAEDMWRFHRATHHLNNMSMIVAIPDEIGIEDCLNRVSAIFKRVEPDAKPGLDPATSRDRMPPAQSGPAGTIRLAPFPHQNANEPGNLIFAWGPSRTLDNNEAYLLELFVGNLADGETANLYRRFIDSQTRVKDLGASSVFGWTSLDLGHPVYVGLENVKRDLLTEPQIDSVRAIVLREIETIASWPDDSPDLKAFNDRAKNRVTERRRSLRRFLNSPPGFGFRGSGSEWMEHLKRLQRTSGFRKSLAMTDELQNAETLLSSGRNIWAERIRNWKLLAPAPYAVAAVADTSLLEKSESARLKRVDDYIGGLEQRYGITDRDQAVHRFRGEYDAKTAAIDAEAAKITMPRFLDNPPMTLDDQLRFTTAQLPGGGALVNSTFDNMTGATAGLAFNMNVVPESLLVYVPALPTLLTEVGVIRDGRPLAYDEMKEAIRREILELNAYYGTNNRDERVELTIRAAGSDRAESEKAVGWMNTVLFDADWRPENLPRMRDAIDLALANARNRMRGSEESWVDEPANAYWKQDDPLLLHTNCFLTEAFALHRMRWLLKEADRATQNEFDDYMVKLSAAAQNANRDQLVALIARLKGEESATLLPPDASALATAQSALSAKAKPLVADAVKDLGQMLSDIPDGSLATDWVYLCGQMRADLATPPSKTLADLKSVMNLIRRADNVRGFMIGSTANLQALQPQIVNLARRLDKSPSARQIYARTPRIVERLRARTPHLARPLFVGLVNDNTRSGVHINTAPCASFVDHDRDKLLNFLAARLYGGGGAHSMFMKTWGAGLAYSNGLRSNESTGRVIYYAERCPDLAQTMQFVVNELKNAPHDTSLAEYAIAQAFGTYRSGSRYEDRGESMAADLADGVTPDAVRSFRQGILGLRDSRDLYSDLHGRMEYVYGQILPGYGPTAEETPNAIFFVIGPEKQFESYENYLRTVEGDVTVARLYPRDFWVVPETAGQ